MIVDCDGSCNDGNPGDITDIINQNAGKNTIQVNLEFEIEEWICISEGISYKPNKPSMILKTQRNYEKFQLPKYANKLQIQVLKGKSSSFALFLESLR
ncbi:MAG: hypothetical protein ACYC9S_13910 [Leptospirales bacterium]